MVNYVNYIIVFICFTNAQEVDNLFWQWLPMVSGSYSMLKDVRINCKASTEVFVESDHIINLLMQINYM